MKPVPRMPSPFADDDETYLDVPEASGAHVGCDCCHCRELRLVDDERIAYTAHELAQAYGYGWVDGRRER